MQGLLEGKVAVITGAGSGVGRAAVKLWCEHGAKVIAVDIDLPGTEESVRLSGAQQGQVKTAVCNVADPAQVEAAVQLAVETFGRLDIIYNNAGITINPVPGQGLKKFVEATPEDMKRVEDVNINGVFYGAQSALRQFEKQGGGGVIVNTASVAGLRLLQGRHRQLHPQPRDRGRRQGRAGQFGLPGGHAHPLFRHGPRQPEQGHDP
jgi:NAD(P)-dependent dehydrogenase (short-subunit alcohol dehydrogenase family)